MRGDMVKEKSGKEKVDYSNPVLSNGRHLNDEAVIYKKHLDNLEICSEDDREVVEGLRDESFNQIYLYYDRFRMRWWKDAGNLFDGFSDFLSFYHDVLISCLNAYKPYMDLDSRREGELGKNSFNIMFFSSLNNRKKNKLAFLARDKRSPNVDCLVCSKKVSNINNFHLKHSYSMASVKSEFGVAPIFVDGVKVFAECPICFQRNANAAHVSQHSYAESMTVHEYMGRFPNAKLNNQILSLDCESEEGQTSILDQQQCQGGFMEEFELKYNEFQEHLDEIVEEKSLLSEVIKYKVKHDYNIKDITMKIGEIFYLSVPLSDGIGIKNRSDLNEYVKRKKLDLRYFNEHYGKVYVSRIAKTKKSITLSLSTVPDHVVSSELSKLRNDEGGILSAIVGNRLVKRKKREMI